MGYQGNTSFHRQKAAENEIRKHATVRSKGDNNMKVPLDFPGGKGEIGDKWKIAYEWWWKGRKPYGIHSRILFYNN